MTDKKETEIKEEKGKKTDKFSDPLDIYKHIFSIHTQLDGLSNDYVMFEPTDKERAYVTEGIELASQVLEFIPDKEIARTIKLRQEKRVLLLAILRRNTKNNFMIRSMLEELQRIEQDDIDIKKQLKSKDEEREKKK